VICFTPIYAQNSEDQIGAFTNGVKDDFSAFYPVDLLQMIPKMARLGLLHQAGVSIAKGNDVATTAIVKILHQTANENKSTLLQSFYLLVQGLLLFVISVALQWN
jgi:hypothetical protein